METAILNPSAEDLSGTPVAWLGLDWGDKKHAFVRQDAQGRESGWLTHEPRELHGFFQKLEERYQGRPVALAIEASRGAVVHVLLQYPWLRIYPINPVTSARYRKAFTPSGAKDDLPDAELLLELVRCHADRLRPLEEQDPETLRLAGLVEARRGLVDQQTAVKNQMTSLLKSYYPQALEMATDLDSDLALDLLERWPDFISLKAAKPGVLKRFFYAHNARSEELIQKRLELIAQSVALTTEESRVSVARLHLAALVAQMRVFTEQIAIFEGEIKEAFAAHPNAALFRDLPGAGAQLAPRLCAAFGTIPTLYPDPGSLQKYAGIAPVREKSGGQIWTHWRWTAPKFVRQTFVEWAGQTVRYSEWAHLYYERMSQQGKKHSAILRALAFKWIRILWKCWQT